VTAIPTTAGPVDSAALGRTMTHEHVHVGSEGMRMQWPHAYDAEAELAICVEETRRLQAHGVETIVDPSCLDLGRDVRINLAVTGATGMRYVMATGIYGVGYRFLPQFVRGDASQYADLFVHDIEVGIQGTDVRAGFLKCAADAPGMVPDIVTIHEAIAEASLRTNTPIMAHSNPTQGGADGGGVGLEQMALFTAKGVDPGMVQIAHVGDTTDLGYIERLLETGCYIGLDRWGTPILTREERNATAVALLERGYGDRLMLGQDSSIVMDTIVPGRRREPGPEPHTRVLFDRVIPELLELGVRREDVDRMLGSNVGAWLAPAA
jgi:phosphotriesterase-related protein